jgi:hypothetical protein
MVNATLVAFAKLSREEINGKWPASRQFDKVWPDPKRIEFVLDQGLKEDVERVCQECKYLVSFL